MGNRESGVGEGIGSGFARLPIPYSPRPFSYLGFFLTSTPLPFFLLFSAAARSSAVGMSFLLVGRTTRSPPLGPGTAPRTSNRLFSLSTLTTSRLRTVTWALPYCPAARWPFLGRPEPRLA